MKTKSLSFRPVSFDGCGINDTDQFASRIATFQNDYLSFGPEMVKRWNAHEGLISGLQDVLNWIRSIDKKCESKICGHYDTSDCIDSYIAAKIARTEQAIAKVEGK